MIFKKIRVLVSLIIFLVPVLTQRVYANDNQLSQVKLEKVEAYVKEQYEKAGIPGGSYAIVYQDQIIAVKGIGYSDLKLKKKASSETIYSIASVTKPFTATAILQLMEQGKLKIDDPVQKYLPWFSYKDKEKSKSVTIKHLLTHSAGINRFDADGSMFKNEKVNRNSLEDSIRSLKTVKMTDSPGVKGQYCNTCFNILGLIIEKVSGESYYDYMKNHVFQPLNLQHTVYGHNLKNQTNWDIAKEYSWFFGFRNNRLLNFETFGKSQDPEGGIYTNAEDLASYVQSMLGHGKTQILDPSTLNRSFEGVVTSEEEDWEYTYGGFTVGKIANETALYKGGDAIGSGASILFLPEQELGVALISGESNSEVKFTITKGILQILLGEEPASKDYPIPLFKLSGTIMLVVTILSALSIIWLSWSIYQRMRTNSKTVKFRFISICLSILFFIMASGLGYLLLTVRLSQIGFYGFPIDWAVGLNSLLITFTLWAIYHTYLSISSKK
ncbi:serine hydrolase domain-containing protein [Bacillus sp. CGMCC 1.16607]|uniref:serine hydrolase domain-containing protein n=1 Tax=Bacillus sp. CGMCC 1.16607 TaxID=3351842 RepID=UPI00362B9AC7